MIIIDRLLNERQERGKPSKAAMVRVGIMGKGLALQIIKYTCAKKLRSRFLTRAPTRMCMT
jgi:predicted homoserine dehydrogenase-like protein